MSVEIRYVVVYTVEHDEHGYITRAEGPLPEQAAMARRNELWDQEGGATVEVIEHVAS